MDILTERLRLRPFHPGYLPAFVAYRSTQLAATDRASGELCGDCAVKVPSDQPATAEVGEGWGR